MPLQRPTRRQRTGTGRRRGRYAEAATLLERAGSPLAIAAAIYAANNDGYRGHGDEALEQLTAIERQLASKGDRYPAIAAEAAWVRGLQLMPKGDSQGVSIPIGMRWRKRSVSRKRSTRRRSES